MDVITTPAAAPLLANHPAVRHVIVYDKRGRDNGPLGFWRLVRRIRASAYTDAYLAQGSSRSGLLAAIGGVKRRVGFDTSAGSFGTRNGAATAASSITPSGSGGWLLATTSHPDRARLSVRDSILARSNGQPSLR